MISRRQILKLALMSPLASLPRLVQAQGLRSSIFEAKSSVVPLVDSADVSRVKVERRWRGSVCQSRVVNQGTEPVRIKEVMLFELVLPLPATTRLYGEGFQMLSQTGGTLGQPADLGNYTDPKHYRLSEPDGARVVYGLATLRTSDGSHHVLAFDSCRRFNGALHIRPSSVQVVVDAEGLSLGAGAQWTLEEFSYASGRDRGALLDALATRLNVNHPPLRFAAPPAGWCSWYWFGPRVTAQQVRDNLDVI